MFVKRRQWYPHLSSRLDCANAPMHQVTQMTYIREVKLSSRGKSLAVAVLQCEKQNIFVLQEEEKKRKESNGTRGGGALSGLSTCCRRSWPCRSFLKLFFLPISILALILFPSSPFVLFLLWLAGRFSFRPPPSFLPLLPFFSTFSSFQKQQDKKKEEKATSHENKVQSKKWVGSTVSDSVRVLPRAANLTPTTEVVALKDYDYIQP